MEKNVFAPAQLGPLSLRNRLLKAATYEGMVVDGVPSRSLLRHHRDLARGGIGMTTVAYCAVSEDGRTFENQMVMGPQTVAGLRVITDAVHREGAGAMLQLGHAGGFSKDVRWRHKYGPLGPSAGFNAYGALKGMIFARAMNRDDMERTVRDFAQAAWHAREAGFDAIELHFGHGYLLSQFLSPFRNRRRDNYGGSLENRLRFPLQVLAAVRKRVGPDFPLLAKTNLDDGVRAGLHIAEAVQIARALESAGITGLVLSGGLVSHSALYLMRGERPLRAMIAVEPHPLQKIGLALFGPLLIPKLPFEPLFFLPLAQQVRAAVSMPLVLLGGVTAVEDLERAMAAGFDFVAIGRALVHDPALPGKFARAELTRSACTPCNVCIAEMDRPGGLICPRVPEQVAMRDDEVRRRWHLIPAAAISPDDDPPDPFC